MLLENKNAISTVPRVESFRQRLTDDPVHVPLEEVVCPQWRPMDRRRATSCAGFAIKR
jgi:hypothetical protein